MNWLDDKGISADHATRTADALLAKWGKEGPRGGAWPYADVEATFRRWAIRPEFTPGGGVKAQRLPAYNPGPPIQVVKPPNGTWASVLTDLQTKITRPAFETWLADTVEVGIGRDGTLVIGTKSLFQSEQLEARMYTLIEAAASAVMGRPTDVSFTVIEDLTPKEEQDG